MAGLPRRAARGRQLPLQRIGDAPVERLAAVRPGRFGGRGDQRPAARAPDDRRGSRDDGSGALDAADKFLSNASMVGTAASLPMNELVTAPEVLWVEVRWANLTPRSTFGLSVTGINSNGTVSFRPPETGLVYLGAAPVNLRVDGAFGDWRGRPYGQDALGDVTNRTGASEYDANVDLVATAVDVGTNFTGYVRVDGRLLGGQDLPTTRTRTYPVPVDTDLDTVPDAVENQLGPNLTRDFNNDNITDDRTGGDVDGDGIVDYPAGPDCWLNTTIPAWYPAPYAGRIVTRYICPIGVPPEEGVDVVYAYIDADNSSATGLWADVQGRIYGFDDAIAVIGRNGMVNSSGLYAFAPAQANPWSLVRPIDVALDAHRMEFSVNASALGLAAGYQVVYFASDWRLGYDVALPDSAVARFPIGAQAATNAVINEVSPQPNPEWVELANPTTIPISLNGWNLALVRGNQINVIFTFTTQTLGAWGSGLEYLSTALPTNSLPNGNAQLLLRQGTIVVDQTAYSPSVGSGQTWARFKDPITGKPMDTNSDPADFYISLSPSPSRANDRHRPTITVVKTESRTVAAPGQMITYTLYYNNTDTGMAKTTWINDTLPSGVVYSSSSVPYSYIIGPTYGWRFANVMPGAHSFTVTVQVTATTTDGQVLRNTVTLDYTDQLSRPLPRSRGWANASFSGTQLVNWAFLNYTTVGGYPLIGSTSSVTVAIPELSDMMFVAVVPVIILGLKVRAKRRSKE